MDYRYLIRYTCELYNCQAIYKPALMIVEFDFRLPGGYFIITLDRKYIENTNLMEIIRYFNYSISEEIEKRAAEMLEVEHDKF